MYITRAATCSSAPTSFTQHKRAFILLHRAFNLYNVIWPESFCGPKIQHNAWKKKVPYTQLTDIMIIRNCPICRYDNSTDCVETAPKEWEFYSCTECTLPRKCFGSSFLDLTEISHLITQNATDKIKFAMCYIGRDFVNFLH
jgi:hypothetical protein